MPLIRIRDLKNGQTTETNYTGEFDDRFVVTAGDLLIGMDGEFRCYEWLGGGALLNQRVCRLQNFHLTLDPRFVLYGVNSHLKEIEEDTAFTTVKHLSAKRISAIEFPVPPLPEQRRIVAVLDEAFEGIAAAKANTERNLRNAREVFRSSADETLRKAAATFPAVSLSSVCDFVRGPFGGSLKKTMFVSEGYAVYEQQHAINDQFSDIRYFIDADKFAAMKRFAVRPSDVIMSCSGTMGRVAIAPPDVQPGIINQALLKLTPSSRVVSEFLRYWMESSAFQVALKESSGGVAMQNVASVKTLKQIEMPLPPVEEQQRIVSHLQAAQSLAACLEDVQSRRFSSLNALKASLLHQAFTGQL